MLFACRVLAKQFLDLMKDQRSVLYTGAATRFLDDTFTPVITSSVDPNTPSNRLLRAVCVSVCVC